MPGELGKCAKLFAWDESGVVLRPGGFSSKDYPWPRVRKVRVHSLFPLIEIIVRDPNGAERVFMLGGRLGGADMKDASGAPLSKFARQMGLSAVLGDYISEFVEAAQAQTHVEVDEGGWWSEPEVRWTAVRGMPGDEVEATGSAYRGGARPEESVRWSWEAPTLPGWLSKVTRFLPVDRFQAFVGGNSRVLSEVSGIPFPDKLAVTEEHVYARQGKKAFRVARQEFRARHDVLSFDRSRLLCSHFIFGNKGRVIMGGLPGNGLDEFSEHLGSLEHEVHTITSLCALP